MNNQFDPHQLIHQLEAAIARWGKDGSSVTLTKAGNCTGNICVYQNDDYCGVIELRNPVTLITFDIFDEPSDA